MRQIADKITYLKLIFTKRRVTVRCSHDSLAFTHRAVVRCACKVARLSQVRPRDNCVNLVSCLMVRGVLSAAVQLNSNCTVCVSFLFGILSIGLDSVSKNR